jgi:CheY-like chemotaxis protein
LEAEGYRVLEARDAAQALELLRRHEGVLHLLLTDIVLPRMNGPELAARARMVRPALRVVYMSAHLADPVVEEQVERQETLLPKPFSSATLKSTVEKALGERRQWKRVPFHTVVRCVWRRNLLNFNSLDLSVGGMWLRGVQTPPTGVNLALDFPLQGMLVIAVGGVVRRRADGFAVSFINMTDAQRGLIEDYTAQSQP